jgi:hypothetical protein
MFGDIGWMPFFMSPPIDTIEQSSQSFGNVRNPKVGREIMQAQLVCANCGSIVKGSRCLSCGSTYAIRQKISQDDGKPYAAQNEYDGKEDFDEFCEKYVDVPISQMQYYNPSFNLFGKAWLFWILYIVLFGGFLYFGLSNGKTMNWSVPTIVFGVLTFLSYFCFARPVSKYYWDFVQGTTWMLLSDESMAEQYTQAFDKNGYNWVIRNVVNPNLGAFISEMNKDDSNGKRTLEDTVMKSLLFLYQ